MQLSILVQDADLLDLIKMLFFKRIVKVLQDHKKYFVSIRKEGFNEAFIYYLIFLFIFNINNVAYELKSFNINMNWYPLAYVVMMVGSVIGFFMFTGITHLFLRWLGGKGNYDATVKGSVYASTPSMVWAFFAGIGLFIYFGNLEIMIALGMVSFVFMIYSVILEVLGMSILHKLSKCRAFLGCFLL